MKVNEFLQAPLEFIAFYPLGAPIGICTIALCLAQSEEIVGKVSTESFRLESRCVWKTKGSRDAGTGEGEFHRII